MNPHPDHPPQPTAASLVGIRAGRDLPPLGQAGTARRIVIIRNGQLVSSRGRRRRRRRGATQHVPSR